MEGYNTSVGYMGYVSGERYRLFETEKAYCEWYREAYPTTYKNCEEMLRMDTFRIIAPGHENDKRGVIRVPPNTYDRLARLSKETGVSICRIVDQCVTFAFERLDTSEAGEERGMDSCRRR